jgi:methyl-accepting chemotaxis protein
LSCQLELLGGDEMIFRGIRAKLTLGLVLIILLTLGLLGSGGYFLSHNYLLRSVEENSLSIGTDYANRSRNYMYEVQVRLECLAATEQIRKSADETIIRAQLDEYRKLIPQVNNINYVDLNGKGIRADGSRTDVKDREYFKKVIATKQPFVSEVIISSSTGKPAVVVCVPVTNQGQMTGMVTGTVLLEQMAPIVDKIKFKESGYGVIVDLEGLVLVDPVRSDFVGKLNLTQKNVKPELKLGITSLDEQLIRLLHTASQEGKQGWGEYHFEESSRIGVVTPITLAGGQRWVLLVSAPKAEVVKELKVFKQMMVAISLFCIMIAFWITYMISGRFVQPIIHLKEEATKIADGDLQLRSVSVRRRDEMGDLANYFAMMSENLRKLIFQVQKKAGEVLAASEMLTHGAHQAAQAANQVATTITDIATGGAIQQKLVKDTANFTTMIATSIEKMTENAQQVELAMNKTATSASNGGKIIENVVQQMENIDQEVVQLGTVIRKLGERSSEIGQIVDTITGISGQTNLLALNAAIEAARAGESGRGFAVVAEEVRKLAEQSKEAAQQIAELIWEIQKDTTKAVSAMEAGIQEAKIGTQVAISAGHSFQEIDINVQHVSTQFQGITMAIRQLASGSEEIVRAVGEIELITCQAVGQTQTVAASTEEQSATMQEIAASSQGLEKLAEDLQEAARKFRI